MKAIIAVITLLFVFGCGGYVSRSQYPYGNPITYSFDLLKIEYATLNDPGQSLSGSEPAEFLYFKSKLISDIIDFQRYDEVEHQFRYLFYDIPIEPRHRFARITVGDKFYGQDFVAYLSKDEGNIVLEKVREGKIEETLYPCAYDEKSGVISFPHLAKGSAKLIRCLNAIDRDLYEKIDKKYFGEKAPVEAAPFNFDFGLFSSIRPDLSTDERSVQEIAGRYFDAIVAETAPDLHTGEFVLEIVREHMGQSLR